MFIARANYYNKEKEMPQYIITYLGGNKSIKPRGR